MDSRKYNIHFEKEIVQIAADDVVVAEGFVLFVANDEDGNVDRTIAMFNQDLVKYVMEDLRND